MLRTDDDLLRPHAPQSDEAHAVAPFALLRIAALPHAALARMAMPATDAAVDTILAAEAGMQACRARVEDDLHALVATLAEDDAATRRLVLALRRDVHNGRPGRLDDAQVEALASRLAPHLDAAPLCTWHRHATRLAAARAQLPLAHAAELQSTLRPALRAPLGHAGFQRGLWFASDGVALAAQREKQLPQGVLPDNFERSLLGYLLRAAAKTSPFSSFMTFAVLPAEARQAAPFPRVERGRWVSRCRLNRGVVARLQGASAAEAARVGDLPLRRNPTLHAYRERLRGLCARDVVVIGRPWMEQRLALFRLDPRLTAALTGGPDSASWDDWRARFATCGIAAAQADTLVSTFLGRGLLLAGGASDGFDPAPERRLQAAWQASRSPTLRALAPTLAALGETAAALSAGTTERAAAAFDTLRASEAQLLGALGRADAEPLQNLVLEDCWQTGAQGVLGRNLLAPLDDLRDFLSTQMILSPHYERLVAHFVAEFGAGGRCTDVPGFLLRAGDKLVDLPEFGARLPTTVPTRAPQGASLHVTAQVQVAVDADGAPQVVVNRVFDGAGWLAARFTLGEQGETALLRERLAAWLVQTAAPCEPVDMPINGHCNDLQAHAPLTRRALAWPGEPLNRPAHECLPADTLVLQHDAARGLLQLLDAAGTPIKLVYLGSTFPNPGWGARYALYVLADPYRLDRPDAAPPPMSNPDGVAFRPRLMHGALVARRASWWLHADYLRRTWFGAKDPAQWLLDARRDCAAHGLPQAFFVQRQLPADPAGLIGRDATKADRKPLWVDTRNPFCLALLQRLCAYGGYLCFNEALPAGDQLWLQVDGEKHVSEIQVEMRVTAGAAADASTKKE